MASGKSRKDLYELFKTGAKPSEQNFKDLIDSALNIRDDGIETPTGSDTPLKITAHGEKENLLDFYVGEAPTWRLSQKPTGAKPGLNFEAGGKSKLFIESDSGNVGIGIAIPTCKLHIDQGELKVIASHDANTANIGSFLAKNGRKGIGIGSDRIEAVGSEANQDISLVPKGTGKLSISGDVSIGPDEPNAKLHIQGSSGNVLNAGASTGSMADIALSGHVQLREYANDNLAYLHARDDSSNRDIGLRIRTQKQGSYPYQKEIIEALTVSPEGHLTVTGQVKSNQGFIFPDGSEQLAAVKIISAEIPPITDLLGETKEKTWNVNFGILFLEPPMVITMISGVDANHEKNLRLYSSAEQVTNGGFILRVKVWADTEVYSTKISWFAFGR